MKHPKKRSSKEVRHDSRHKGSYTLFQSFSFAFQGIIYALRSERNLRIHGFVALAVVYFSRYYQFTRAEKALLFLSIGLVITCELFNTSIETTVDLESPAYHALAKIAKDVAAGAVLVSSLASVGVGILLFWDWEILKLIFSDVLARWYLWVPILAITLIIIFLPESQRKNIAQKIAQRLQRYKEEEQDHEK